MSLVFTIAGIVTGASVVLTGALWLVLSDADGVEDRIGAAAEALRAHAPDLVEGRYLPPAVRQRLAC